MEKYYKIKIALLISIFMFSNENIKAQISFEKIITQTNSGGFVEELSTGGFIALTGSGIMKLDMNGNYLWTSSVLGFEIHCVVEDPNGGFVACGSTLDTATQNGVGCLIHLNDSGQFLSSINFPQDVDGSFCPSIRITKDSCYLVTCTLIGSSQSRTSVVYFVDRQDSLILSNIFTARDHSYCGLKVDNSNNHLCGTFSSRSAAFSTISKADRSGNLLATFSGVTDTVLGGSIVLDAIVGEGESNEIYFGTNLLPYINPSYAGYLVKLDQNLIPIWTKVLDYGSRSNILSIANTIDSGAVVLGTVYNGSYSKLCLYKVDAQGDSVWSRNYYGIGLATGSVIRTCNDGGLIIIGTTTDSSNTISYGYIIKTDALGRILPNVSLSISGSLQFCDGDSVILSAQPGNRYLWSNGDTATAITIKTTGSYFATIEDSNGVQAYTDTINVTVFPTPNQPVISEALGVLYGDTINTYTAYQWYFNGIPIINSDSASITPIQSGDYTVQVTDSFGCSSISLPFPFVNTDINRLNNQAIKITPNPALDFLFVSNLNQSYGYIEIYNALGVLVLKQPLRDASEIRVDISSLKSGSIYNVSIKNDSGVNLTTKMIVKE